ncbi:MAG: VanZ family protein [Clostridia bacterium]|nr:VanZ family protein [Clostridia bacterium]
MSAKRTVLIGFLISFFIELCQLFTPRSTDVDDLWLNALGIFIGTVIFKTVGNLIKRKAAAPEKENS